MAKNNIFKRQVQKISGFFTHLPLFAKYLTIMTALMLVSYLVLMSALTVFLSNRWAKETQELLQYNVKQSAEYSEDVLATCDNPEDVENALYLLCNNIGVTANAVNIDIFFVNHDGKVILCREDFLYNYSPSSSGCLVHSGYKIPQSIMDTVANGEYFSRKSVEGLFAENTFFAGYPVYMKGTFVGAFFASSPIHAGLAEYALNLGGMYLSSAIFASALSFLVIYAFTAKLTNPLRQMSNATKAYAQGDFSKRVSVRGVDELAELCQSFNKMATALSVLESSRRSFVANVSHELKTPMTTIGGFIDGMLDGTIPPEKHQEYLNIVSVEVKRLSRLVTSMLNLSKIEAGELEIKPTNFDAVQQIINCMLTFEQEIEKKNITINGFDNLNPVIVYADRDMIYQVVYNLVDNAVKFTNENGAIFVFAGEDKNGRMSISIENTGEGISSEETGRIFERFYKVDKSRSYDVKSAGLGLYLCKTIVEMHGGTIFAESEKSKFTRFTFTLPKGNGKNNA
jgi:signal transduction histidine kinase